jgi:3-methyladenine DNA glycosylase AlkD
MDAIYDELMKMREEPYGEFQRKLIPTVAPESILGVRTPALRKLAKEMGKAGTDVAFLEKLPHTYFEENQLHGFLLSERKDFASCIRDLERFFPFMDNWATCDQTSPKIFRKKKEELMPYLRKWIQSDHEYTVRFAVNMLMQHFLGEDFRPEYLEMVAEIRSERYYVNMGIAWYMSMALVKQWETAVPYVEQHRLAPWVHNCTIQKARESRQITEDKKEYLKQYKIPGVKTK